MAANNIFVEQDFSFDFLLMRFLYPNCFNSRPTMAAIATKIKTASGQPMNSHGALPPDTLRPQYWQNVALSSHCILQLGQITRSFSSKRGVHLMSAIRGHFEIAGEVYSNPRTLPHNKGWKLI